MAALPQGPSGTLGQVNAAATSSAASAVSPGQGSYRTDAEAVLSQPPPRPGPRAPAPSWQCCWPGQRPPPSVAASIAGTSADLHALLCGHCSCDLELLSGPAFAGRTSPFMTVQGLCFSLLTAVLLLHLEYRLEDISAYWLPSKKKSCEWRHQTLSARCTLALPCCQVGRRQAKLNISYLKCWDQKPNRLWILEYLHICS